jgi:hypothetical protein
MAESAQIDRVSIKHEAIMDFLLAHPMIKIGDVARHFGMTAAWMSTVIHSDGFQMMLKQKQGAIFHNTVLPIREKMLALANQGLDLLEERLPMITEGEKLAKVTSDILDKLGYSSRQPAVQINNQVNNTQMNVQVSELQAARQLLGTRAPERIEKIEPAQYVEPNPLMAISRPMEESVYLNPPKPLALEVNSNGNSKRTTAAVSRESSAGMGKASQKPTVSANDKALFERAAGS